jgi:enamine deaminase RidA (YjgF/YER057c/UK114 family)
MWEGSEVAATRFGRPREITRRYRRPASVNIPQPAGLEVAFLAGVSAGPRIEAMALEKINPNTLSKPHGFSHVVVATGPRLVLTSGQTPIDLEGKLVGKGPDYRAQGLQAASNLYAALEAGGAAATDIARMTIYVVDATDENLNDLYAGLGQAGRDAGAKATCTTLVGVASIAIPGAVVEIEAMAITE